jgi:uncharacterized protein YneF (UPF0154 family)
MWYLIVFAVGLLVGFAAGYYVSKKVNVTVNADNPVVDTK